MAPLIQRLTAEQVRPLRQAALRPGRPLAECIYPGDDAPTTAHFGLWQNWVLTCVATSMQVACPAFPTVAARQLRGVATWPAHQNHGYGRLVIEAALAHAQAEGAVLVWCYGRTAAWRFYERLGFIKHGAEFDRPVTGAHYYMLLRWLLMPPTPPG